jgi:hypothetical protein
MLLALGALGRLMLLGAPARLMFFLASLCVSCCLVCLRASSCFVSVLAVAPIGIGILLRRMFLNLSHQHFWLVTSSLLAIAFTQP